MLRAFTQADVKPYRRLMAICYAYSLDEKDSEPLLTEKQLKTHYGIFGDDGSLKCAMIQHDMQCWFEGQKCKMLGIGGVVTDPIARRGGGIRRLFEECLPRLYGEGYTFSALYPFSHIFYRKFGYEYAVEKRRITFATHSLRKNLQAAASIRRLLPEDDGADVEALYEAWAKQYNLAFDLSNEWTESRSGQPWQLQHTYLLFNAAGEPISFWIGRISKDSGETVLNLSRLAWKNREGMEAIFAMIGGMNEIHLLKMTVPPGLPLRYLLNDPYDVADERIECGGMVRIMNVCKALSMLPAPRAAGEMVIEVQDDQIAENCGFFHVAGDGRCIAVQKLNHATPDLRCSIGALTVLVTGTLDLRDAALAGLMDMADHANADWISQVFVRRKLYMNCDF